MRLFSLHRRIRAFTDLLRHQSGKTIITMAEKTCPLCHADLVDLKIMLQETGTPSGAPAGIVFGTLCTGDGCGYHTLLPGVVFDTTRVFVELNEFDPNFTIIWPLLVQSVEACILSKKPVPDDIFQIFTPIMREQLYLQFGGKEPFRKDWEVKHSFVDGRIVWDLVR